MRKTENKFWTRIFGIHVGDLIRFKYGKVVWEVYKIQPWIDGRGETHLVYKIWRDRVTKNPILYSKRISTYFWDWEPRTGNVIKVGRVGKK